MCVILKHGKPKIRLPKKSATSTTSFNAGVYD